MRISREDAIQILTKWQTEQVLLFGMLHTPSWQAIGLEVKANRGIQIIFRGRVRATPVSLSFSLPDEGTLLVHFKDADFDYGDQREASPLMQQWINQNFEHFLHISGGHLYIKGEKKWPTWECTLFEPLNP